MYIILGRRTGITITLAVVAIAVVPYLVASNYASSRETRIQVLGLGDSSLADALSLVGGDGHAEELSSGPFYRLDANHVTLTASVANPDQIDSLTATLRFRSDLVGGQRLQVGVRDVDGKVTWIDAYGPVLQGLTSDWKQVAANGDDYLFASDPTSPTLSPPYSIANPPPYARVSSDSKLYAPQSPAIDELPILGDRDPNAMQSPSDKAVHPIPVGLKGDFTVHFFSVDENVSVGMDILDLNRGKGADAFNVTVRQLDGTVLKNIRSDDDGDVASDRVVRGRHIGFDLPVEAQSWNVLEIRATTPDIVIDHLSLPGVKLFPKQITLAGPTFGAHGSGPVSTTLRTNGGSITAQPLQDAYATILQALNSGWQEIGRNATHRLYAATAEPGVNITAFVGAPPLYKALASSADGFVPQSPAKSEIPSISSVRGPPRPSVTPVPAADVPIGVRSDATVEFYAAEATARMVFGIRDNNKGAGYDGENITLRSLDGFPIDVLRIPDDGTVTASNSATMRTFYMNETVEAGQWYILEVRGSTTDLQFENFQVPGPTLFVKGLTMGGGAYGTHSNLPADVAIRTPGGKLTATAATSAGIQKLVVTDSAGAQQTIDVNRAATPFTLQLAAGNYTVRVLNATLTLSITDGYFSFNAGPLPLPRPVFVQQDASGILVRAPLRGDNSFWTFVESPSLSVSFGKRDTNSYDGEDSMTVTLEDVAGHVIRTTTVVDDGDTTASMVTGSLQSVSLQADNLASGSYKIETHGSGDYRIRDLRVNQQHLVAESLYPLGYNSCCFKTQPSDNQLDVYYEAMGPGPLTATPVHAGSIQTLKVYGPGASMGSPNSSIALAATGTKYAIGSTVGQPIRINIPSQDIQLAGPGYFAFTADSFFFPLRDEIVAFKTDANFLKANAAYVLVSTKGYESLFLPPERSYAWSDSHALVFDNPRQKTTVTLPRGTYKVTSLNASVSLTVTDGYFSFEPAPLPVPNPGFVHRTDKGLEIREPLRGNHVFWTYVEGDSLDVRLTKQDLNLYPGTDELMVNVTDVAGNSLKTIRIPNSPTTAGLGPLQPAQIHLDGLVPGSYRIAMSGSGDYLLRSLFVNQKRLVAESLFLIGYNSCCFKNAALDNQVSVYYDSLGPGNLSAVTGHAGGLGSLPYFEPESPDDEPEGNLTLNATSTMATAMRPAHTPVRILVAQQDVTLKGPGYFSFTSDSFFFPIRNPVIPYKPDLVFLKANVDLVHRHVHGFQRLADPDEGGVWTWTHTWDVKDLGIQGGKLPITLQITNFNAKGAEGRTVSIQAPEIALREKPFLHLGPVGPVLRRLFH